MKKLTIFNYLTILSLLFLINCTRTNDELQSENAIHSLSTPPKMSGKASSGTDLPMVYAVIFSDNTCTGGLSYKYYATSTDVVPYDRHIYSIAKRGDATIILPLRIIPANQNVSAAVGVFLNENVKIKDISVQAQHVFSNGNDISGNFERPFINIYVDNCLTSTVSPPANPCQVDANDNGTPDCFE